MVRRCKCCGEEFQATGTQAYCDRDHFGTCTICGKIFIYNPRSPKQCCSRKCSSRLRIQTLQLSAKVCRLCGKEFIPMNNTQIYCKDTHIVPCVVCGKPVPILDCEYYRLDRTCSVECSNNRRKSTCIDKYGVPVASQFESTKDKLRSKAKENEESRKQNCLLKYGFDNVAKVPSIKNKIRNTIHSNEYQTKVHISNLKRYGVSYASQSLDVQNKMKLTNLERYGVEYPTQCETVKSKMIKTLYNTRIQDPSINHRSVEAIHDTCKERYGVDWPCQLEQCRQASGAKSNINNKFKSICESSGILLESEFHLGSYSYDFRVVGQNTLIEIDPTYTHNAIGNHWTSKGLSYDYHKLKSELAESKGFRCIHIFDWDNYAKIIDIIRPKQVVYARHCTILEVSSIDCDSFLNSYHLQNTCRGQTIRLGLYYDGELIQLLSLGKPRYNKNYEWELLRLCSHSKYKVLGGASKLFKHFINTYEPNSIISYCDKSKFKGDVYSEIGMNLKYTAPPAKVWSNGKQKITDNLLRQRGFDQIFHTDFGKGTSNEGLMIEHGWLPVYDCGQAAYTWFNH